MFIISYFSPPEHSYIAFLNWTAGSLLNFSSRFNLSVLGSLFFIHAWFLSHISFFFFILFLLMTQLACAKRHKPLLSTRITKGWGEVIWCFFIPVVIRNRTINHVLYWSHWSFALLEVVLCFFISQFNVILQMYLPKLLSKNVCAGKSTEGICSATGSVVI